MNLEPRTEVFDTYWTFAAERQRVFFRRLAGEPPPWTEDPILRDHKFTNAYRASDRVSQYLIREVIYAPGFAKAEDVIFRTLLFRLFNKIEAWKTLEGALGPLRADTFDVARYGRVLGARKDRGETIFGAAYIMCANKSFGHDAKHLNYLMLVEHMLQDGVVRKATASKSLRDLYRLLIGYPLIGKFVAYQLATDLNYSEVIDFPEDSFTQAGPGARRGIEKCFEDTGAMSDEEVIHWMVDEQEAQFARLGIDFPSLWGRPLQAIDCQNLFCETDKYARIAFPELKSDRTRIKAKYEATSKPLGINYFYPPKWGINDKVPRGPTPRAEGERRLALGV